MTNECGDRGGRSPGTPSVSGPVSRVHRSGSEKEAWRLGAVLCWVRASSRARRTRRGEGDGVGVGAQRGLQIKQHEGRSEDVSWWSSERMPEMWGGGVAEHQYLTRTSWLERTIKPSVAGRLSPPGGGHRGRLTCKASLHALGRDRLQQWADGERMGRDESQQPDLSGPQGEL